MIQEVLESDFAQRLKVIDNDIDLTILYNPFDKTDRTDTKLIWAPGKSLADYLDGLPTEVEWVVAVNHKLVTAEKFAVTTLSPADKLTIAVVPQGSAKSILRIVAIIVVIVAAIYLGPAIATALGYSATGSAAAGITAGLTAIGGLLVNSLLPPPKPTSASTSGDSPSYGYDGPANTATEDAPIPVIYGTFVTGGNIINSSTQTDGETQYLFMETAVSEGEVSQIYDVKLNGQSAAYWNDITVETRTGKATQGRIPWFNNTLISEGVGQILDIEANAITHTTLEAVEQFRLDFVFPQGMALFDIHGNQSPMDVTIKSQYRLHGTTTWIDLPDILNHHNQRSVVRVSALSPVLDLGIYDIRTWRTVAERTDNLALETCQLTQVVGILLDPVNYNNTAVVGLKIKADKQLSSFPTLTCTVDGVLIHTYDAYGNDLGLSFNNNPAWVALDMLTNSRYGGNLALTRFDMARWYDWAQSCTALGLGFNGVFDTTTNLWDAVQNVMRIGRAQIIRTGQLYTVAMEVSDDPVMLFGPGNMLEKSFQMTWLSLTDRANEIEVQYNDATDNYRQHTVRVVDNDAYNRGDAPKQSSIALLGCTNFDQAQREAYLQLALNKYVTLSATWDAPVEAIACTVGDVVFVAHDMPNWSTSGRIAPGSTAAVINLDKPVTIDGTSSYQLLILHSAVHVLDVSVISVNGNSITINAQPNIIFHRVIKGSKDMMMMRRTTVGGQEIIQLDDASSINNGDTVALWAVDFIETIPVTGMAAGTYTSITLDRSLVQNPTDFANYMFGPLATVQRPFRIQKIQGSGDHHRTLTALEYNANIYLDPENPAQPPIYTSPQFTIAPIQVDHWVEELIGRSDKRSRVSFFWAANPGLTFVYDGADIYLTRGTEPEKLIATVRNAETTYSVDADVGDVLTVRLVPIDNKGKRGNALASTPVSYTVIGNNIAPPAPTGLTATAAALSITLNWVNPLIPNLHHIEIYESTADDLTTASHIADSMSSQFLRAGLPKNSTRYYWVRAVDNNGNVSAFSNSNTAGAVATTLANLTTDLVGQIVNAQIAKNAIDASNLISSQQLVQTGTSISSADHTISNFFYDTTAGQMYTWNGSAWVVPTAIAKAGSITTASFAAGLSPVQVVSSLSSISSPAEGATAMLTSDGQLYRYHAGVWTAAVPATNITGQLTDSQLAALSTSKLTGSITAAQIQANSITAAQIATGAITANELSAGAVTANKLAANSVTASSIAANAITTASIQAGAVSTAQLAAGAVTASILAVDSTNMVTDPTFADVTARGWGANVYWQQLGSGGQAFTAWGLEDGTTADAQAMQVQACAILSANANGVSTGSRIRTQPIVIDATQAYRMGVLVYASGGALTINASAQTIQLRATFVDGTGSSLSTISSGAQPASAFKTTTPIILSFGATGETAIPAGAVAVRFDILVLNNSDTTHNFKWCVASPSLRLGVSGTMLTPGSISTAHISTSGLDASAITAGTITAAQIATGGIVANNIAGGTITGNKIATRQLTATHLVLGTLTGDVLNANFFQGQTFTAAAGTNGYLQMDGNVVSNGGKFDGPAFRVYDNQATPAKRVVVGRDQNRYGLFVWDASGNPVFVEDGLADSTVSTGTITAGAVTKPYGFAITTDISVVQGPIWSPIWTQGFTVDYPANGVFHGSMFINFNSQNGMNFRYRVRAGSATGTDQFSPVSLGPGIFVTQSFVGTFGVGAGTFYFVLEAQTITADGNNAHIIPGSTGMMLVCQR
jgi:predicted phage tail protein